MPKPRSSSKSRQQQVIRDFSRSLPMLLLRARESIMRHFRASLNQHDLTEQQWRVLRALASVGEVEVTGLARLTFLHGPSLTRILRDLERRRLLSRKAAKNDLRIGIISLSPRGQALIAEVGPHSEAIYADISAHFGPKNLAALEKLLLKLEASAGPSD